MKNENNEKWGKYQRQQEIEKPIKRQTTAARDRENEMCVKNNEALEQTDREGRKERQTIRERDRDHGN